MGTLYLYTYSEYLMDGSFGLSLRKQGGYCTYLIL